MHTQTAATEVVSTARMHLELLDQFAATVLARLNAAETDYARESLAEMLDTIADQRDAYIAVLNGADRMMLAA